MPFIELSEKNQNNKRRQFARNFSGKSWTWLQRENFLNTYGTDILFQSQKVQIKRKQNNEKRSYPPVIFRIVFEIPCIAAVPDFGDDRRLKEIVSFR